MFLTKHMLQTLFTHVLPDFYTADMRGMQVATRVLRELFESLYPTTVHQHCALLPPAAVFSSGGDFAAYSITSAACTAARAVVQSLVLQASKLAEECITAEILCVEWLLGIHTTILKVIHSAITLAPPL